MTVVNRYERWRLIESVVGRAGEASREQIERELPAKLDLRGRKLGTVLRRMVNGFRLEKARHGVFRLHPNHGAHSMSMFEFMERRIEQVLRDQGGIAKREDIEKGLGGRRRGRSDRPYEHTLLTRVLRESPKFHRDFGYGYWNLGEAERVELPLTGYWAANLPEFAEADELKYAFFAAVGAAFTEARQAAGLGIDEAAFDPNVLAALRRLDVSCQSLRREVLNEAREEALRKGAISGVSAYTAVLAQKSDIPASLLAMFEAGHPVAHAFADASLYQACGALYGVCPARLSRGIVAGDR